MMLPYAALLALSIVAQPPTAAPRRAGKVTQTAPAVAARGPAVPVLDGSSGAIVGRLVVRERGKELTPRELSRRLPGKALALDLRQGWGVVTAPLDEDGYFVARAAPGRWRIEYLLVGEDAEVFAEPQEVEARAGDVVCAGQLELEVSDAATELGTNSSGSLRVLDRCSEIGAALRSSSQPGRLTPGLAAPSAVGGVVERGVLEILSGLRGFATWGSTNGEAASTYGGAFVLGLPAPLDTRRNFLAMVSAGSRTQGRQSALTLAAGAGYAPFSALELMVGPEYRQSTAGAPGGLRGFASARLGVYAFGIGARAGAGPGGTEAAITLDLSPIYLVGSLL